VCFGGYKRDGILCVKSTPHETGIVATASTCTSAYEEQNPGVFPIKVEGQRACNHEPLPGMVHRFRGVIAEVTADVLNPFSYNPETIISLGYADDVKIRERSEPLKGG
jgi:hypothetical protein